MGMLWVVWPLDEAMRAWLASQDIAVPADASRFPTKPEVVRCLADPGLGLRRGGDRDDRVWDAFLESGEEWTNLFIDGLGGDDAPCRLHFDGGHVSLIRRILQHLARACGPLVLLCEAGGPPEVMTASDRA
jgi:hypothetical protein